MDIRVAHWQAQQLLKMIESDPELLAAQAFTLALGECEGLWRRKESRRNVRRHFERKVVPVLRAQLRFSGAILDYDGDPVYHGFAFVGSPTIGFAYRLIVFNIANGGWNTYDPVVIKPHAIDRLIQRTNAQRPEDYLPELMGAVIVGESIRFQYMKLSCAQVAVPGGEGLFVGERNGNQLILNTWFAPGANDRPSKWDGIQGLFAQHIGLVRIDDPTSIAPMLRKVLGAQFEMQGNPSISERFPFLLKPHAFVEDPLDKVWEKALQQSSTRH